MNISLSTMMIYLCIPLVTGMGAYIVKTILNRIDILETKVDTHVTEIAVRTLLNDKLEPIHQDIQEINYNIKKLYDLFFQQSTPRKPQ